MCDRGGLNLVQKVWHIFWMAHNVYHRITSQTWRTQKQQSKVTRATGYLNNARRARRYQQRKWWLAWRWFCCWRRWWWWSAAAPHIELTWCSECCWVWRTTHDVCDVFAIQCRHLMSFITWTTHIHNQTHDTMSAAECEGPHTMSVICFASSYDWDVISRYWSKSAFFIGGGSTGRQPPTSVAIRKLE